jgi:hypothetical protein
VSRSGGTPPAINASTVGGRLAGGTRRQLADHQREQVHGLQHELDLDGTHRPRAGAREIEQGLEPVRDVPDRRETDHAGVALDGMEGPEDVVHERQIARRRLELQDRVLDGAEVIQRIGDEHARQLRVGDKRRQLVVHGRRRIVFAAARPWLKDRGRH